MRKILFFIAGIIMLLTSSVTASAYTIPFSNPDWMISAPGDAVNFNSDGSATVILQDTEVANFYYEFPTGISSDYYMIYMPFEFYWHDDGNTSFQLEFEFEFWNATEGHEFGVFRTSDSYGEGVIHEGIGSWYDYQEAPGWVETEVAENDLETTIIEGYLGFGVVSGLILPFYGSNLDDLSILNAWPYPTSGDYSIIIDLEVDNGRDEEDDPHSVAGVTFGPFVVTPIPGAVWLLGSGLIGLVGFRRKFNKPYLE